ncbi:hypothetical protein BGX31_001695 [Mortierella sp. GBA43]|nr:hypothetical protein BGX31_001695 [Mortierella sp. GBA43]
MVEKLMDNAFEQDDDDDDDDGEIKHYSNRTARRSSSARQEDPKDRDSSSSNGTNGHANKKQLDHDHSDLHKCSECGKVYKHPNCLWKHRWLHSVYWKGATRFLLSKHQQVQLMEAAAILLGMDETRQGDKDPIVSMFTKQRGALANSVGSHTGSPTAQATSSSSSSGSPATSIKSLSPPLEDRDRKSGRSSPIKVHQSDIQILNAFLNSARHSSTTTNNNTGPSWDRDSGSTHVKVKVKVEPTLSDSKLLLPSAATSLASLASSALSAASATLPASSSMSTLPTLAPDDETMPDAEEDHAMISSSPPSHRNSVSLSAVSVVSGLTGTTTVVRVGAGAAGAATTAAAAAAAAALASVGAAAVEMNMELDMMDQKPLKTEIPLLKKQQQQQQEPSSLPFYHGDSDHRAPRFSGSTSFPIAPPVGAAAATAAAVAGLVATTSTASPSHQHPHQHP